MDSEIYSVIVTIYDPSWSPPYETYSIDIVPGIDPNASFTGTKEECEQFEKDYDEAHDYSVYE